MRPNMDISKEKGIETFNDELIQKIDTIMTSGLNPIKHLEQFNYPRKAGTEGDNRIANYVFKTLKDYGYKPKTQEFYFYKEKRYPSLKFSLLLVSWVLLSFLNILFLNNNLIISIIILSAPTIVIFALLNFRVLTKFFLQKNAKKIHKLQLKVQTQTLKTKEKKRVIKSKNILIEIGPDEAENHIMFTAHVDTISSKVSMKIMKFFGIAGILSFILFTLSYSLNVISILILDWNFLRGFFPFFLLLSSTMLFFIEGLVIFRSLRKNDSHGIIDDGTGVAILLELAKFLKGYNIQNTRFIFGFFSAEEAGLIGSSHYYNTSNHDKNKLHVISVDMIGEKAPLNYIKGISPIKRITMDPVFNSRIESLAKRLEIKIEGTNFIYPGSDFAHWLFNGYKSNWFINSSNCIHSKNDILDNVNENLVTDALRLIIGYIVEFLA